MKLYQKFLTEIENRTYDITENSFDQNEVTPPKRNPQYEKWLNSGKGALIALASVSFIPGSLVVTAYLTHLFDLTAYKCYIICKKSKNPMLDICVAKCKVNAAKWVINYIQTQIKQAEKIENKKDKKQIEKRLYEYLTYWRQQKVEYEIKLKTIKKYSKSWTKV